jgi:hypothetical protein
VRRRLFGGIYAESRLLLPIRYNLYKTPLAPDLQHNTFSRRAISRDKLNMPLTTIRALESDPNVKLVVARDFYVRTRPFNVLHFDSSAFHRLFKSLLSRSGILARLNRLNCSLLLVRLNLFDFRLALLPLVRRSFLGLLLTSVGEDSADSGNVAEV